MPASAARRFLRTLFSSVLSGALLAGSVSPAASWAQVAPQPGLGAAFAPDTARPALTAVRAVAVAAPRAALAQTGSTLVGDGFSESATSAGAWVASGDACLTAGTSSTPSTSIGACGATAAQDPVGAGALELTTPATNQVGMLVAASPVSTANGLQVTFTDYSFGGSATGADGMLLFLSDASKARPVAAGQVGGSLGYANETVNGVAQPGLANGYIGLALDEFGNFSNPTQGRNGGPGAVPETLAVRGAAAANYPYLGGATASGKAASLPFSFDQPSATARPANAPTVRLTLTPAGLLSVALDRHDGNGFVAYYSQNVVGVAGQPAVPASVYVGIVSSTGGSYERHQIGGFAVTALTPSSSFAPTGIANLSAWYDASDPSSVTQGTGGVVTGWNDKSGNGNALGEPTASIRPTYTSAGIDGLGSVAFNGGQYLYTANGAFSKNLFGESTTFAVTNQVAGAPQSLTLLSGSTTGNPRWSFMTAAGAGSEFDFDDTNADGKLAPADVSAGPALWSAAGSTSTHAQYLRKNGNLLASGTGPAGASGNYAFAVGAALPSGGAAAKYSGQLGEIVTYDRLLTLAESQQVEGYLACKWGLQNRLPANHPYRTACPQGGSPTALPTAAPAANALASPPELRSVNGSLVFNVTAQQAPNSTDPQFVYNGSTALPTLRLLPGDTLIVNLVNALPAPPAGAPYMNDASLHYHGLHVSPTAPADDSIDMLAAPGQSLHYQITIPANHPTGLYWYHSHAHGETDRQNSAGMSGALIVDGIAASAPQVANLPERVLVVRDGPLAGQPLPNAVKASADAMRWSMAHGMAMGPGAAARTHASAVRGSTTAATRNPYVLVDPNYRKFVRPLAASTHCTTNEAPVKALTLNGQTQPSIGIRPGEQQFWRLVNAGSDTYLDVQVDNTQMQILALDGVPVGSGVNTPASLTVSHYVVPPASRIEFVVTGPPAGQTAYLRTNCFDAGASGDPMPATTLAAIDPTSSLSDLARTRAPQRISPRAVQPRSARSIASQPVARTQSFYYSDQNTINGVAYDPGAPPMFYAQSGTVEEWTVINNSSQVHTFHIHQLHFVVEAIDGVTQAQQFLLDNVNVPAATANGPGSVKLLVDFTDPLDIGTFLLHCHIMSHEDGGMMAAIRVGTAPPMTVGNGSVSFASATAPAQTVSVSGGQAPYSVTGCSGVANGSVSGSTVTIAPAGAGSCVLTVADSSGLTATISVTVQAAAAAIALAPTSVSFAGPNSAAQNVTISGGTPAYAAAGCNGVAGATVSGATLTVTPQAVGSCTITVSDAASNTQTLPVSVNSSATGSPQDNLTFHQNAARQGWYRAETALTTASVASASFGSIATLSAPSGMPAFGKVYAQPLYASGETVADGSTHNLVLIATSTDQVYAFDDVTRSLVWHRDFTNSAAGIRQQLSTDTGCNDVNPNVGITGTPVIDRALDRMYVAVPTDENGTFHLRLHAISLKSGLEATGASGAAIAPVEISASTALATGGVATTSPEWNFQRSALLEANGNVYVSLGSHCDYQGAGTHGWVIAYDATTLAAAGNVVNASDSNDGSGKYLGAIWMSGFGPAADSAGNVYFVTGNGPWNGTQNFGMSVVSVPGNLDVTKAGYFTPYGWAKDSSTDQDLGAGGIMLLPDQTAGTYPHLALMGGKCGAGSTPDSLGRVGTDGCQKYLLNRDKLGGMQSGDAGALWHADTGGGMWGGPAYFADASGAQHVVYGDLNTYNLNLSPVSLSVQSTASVGCLECRNHGSQPVVSSNGTTAGTAVAWALKTPGNAGGTITLYAFDALNLSHVLFSGGAGSWLPGSGAPYIGGALVSPLVANGKVYVPSDGAVTVFGLH